MSSAGLKIDTLSVVPGAGVYVARRELDPDRWFEFVDASEPGVPRIEKWVIMISTQFGCSVGCSMCDVGGVEYRGNLSVREMLTQLRTVLSAHPEIDPSKVGKLKLHFARMGEPSLNPAVVDTLAHLARAKTLPGLLPSVSTVAPNCSVAEDFFARLYKIKEKHFGGGRFQLQFSVHSTDEDVRGKLIPVLKWSLERIADFGPRWRSPGDRKLTLNFALPDQVPFDPAVLDKIFSPEHFLVKFTPVHPTDSAARNGLSGMWYEPSERIVGLSADLRSRGFEVILNPPWPEELKGGASCGQLATAARRKAEALETETVC